MAVWVVPHKPRGGGHLLMETNETKHEWEMTQTRKEGTKKMKRKTCFVFCHDLHKTCKKQQSLTAAQPGIILHPFVEKPQALWLVVLGLNEVLIGFINCTGFRNRILSQKPCVNIPPSVLMIILRTGAVHKITVSTVSGLTNRNMDQILQPYLFKVSFGELNISGTQLERR